MRMRARSIPILISVLELLLIGFILFRSGVSQSAVRGIVAWTPRLSVLLFLLAFTASSLYRLFPSDTTKWLLKNRRYIGVSFALTHFIHLGSIVLKAATFPEAVDAERTFLSLLPGALSYLFIGLMAITSNDWSMRWLGAKKWRLLHTVGAYYIWLSFAEAYTTRGLTESSYLALALLVYAALILRIVAWARSRARSNRG